MSSSTKESPAGRPSSAEEDRPERPRRFRVVLHNDDYTTMEFVILVLIRFFKKTESEATEIMLNVHHKGRGVAGTYPRDVAESKVLQVMTFSEQNSMPLLVTTEPETIL